MPLQPPPSTPHAPVRRGAGANWQKYARARSHSVRLLNDLCTNQLVRYAHSLSDGMHKVHESARACTRHPHSRPTGIRTICRVTHTQTHHVTYPRMHAHIPVSNILHTQPLPKPRIRIQHHHPHTCVRCPWTWCGI